MEKSIKIFRLFGIDVELHYSWFFVFLLLAWGLSSDFFPGYYPDLSSFEYWTMGIISSLLLFASVLFHEMSHSLTAKKDNIPVDKITLFFFGGVASIGGEDKMAPMKEFKMAIAGPLMSLVLALVFFLVLKMSSIIYITAIAFYLSRLNLILALFNLVPGYPLDGGRVLRSIIWGITKDVKKATRIASNGGKIVASILVIIGFLGMFAGAGTLWFIILGFFLYFIAGASYNQIMVKETLSKLKVKDVMVIKVNTVSPNLTVADFFENYILKYGIEGAFVAKDKTFLGAVSVEMLKGIPKQKWMEVRLKDIMISKIESLKENENAFSALAKMSKLGLGVMPVIKNKKLIGAVSGSLFMRKVKS